MPSLTAVTIRPARRLAGRLRVPGDKSISHRYALLAALAEGRSHLAGYAPGADCRSTLACLRALGVEIVKTRRRIRYRDGTRFGPTSFTRRAARRRQLGDDDEVAGGRAGGPGVLEPHGRRRIALPAPDAPRDRAARAHGRTHRVDRRPCASCHPRSPRRAVARDCTYGGGPERAGQERGAAGRAPRRRHHVGRRAGADARPHRTRARGVRRDDRARLPGNAGRVGRRRPAAGRPHAVDSRRLLVRGVLDGRRGRAARLARRDRGRRPQPDADRARRRPAPLRRARAGRGHRHRRRRAARHDHRRRRSHRRDRDRARGGAGPDRRAAGDRGAGGARRRGDGARRGRAARQGKRPHRDAGGGLPRARHRRRRAARRLHGPRPGRAGGGVADAHGDHRMAMAFAIAALGARGRRRSKAPTRSRSPIPASSTRWTGSSREGRQGVPGRVHGGRQDDGGARAGQAARLARRWTSTS